MILNEVKRKYVRDLLAHGKRADGRGLLDYRDIQVQKGILPNAEGSAQVTLGGTTVLAGVKFDLATPFPDRPKEGVFVVNAEFTPGAHPEFEAGPPNENSVELARVVDRGLRSAETVDPQKLFIKDGKVFGLYVDLYILDHLGNLTDAAALAAMAALQDAKFPVVENDAIVREKNAGPIPLSHRVVTTTFVKIDGHILADPSEEEEAAADAKLTLGVADGEYVAAGQKAGAGGFTTDEMEKLIALSLQKSQELLTHL